MPEPTVHRVVVYRGKPRSIEIQGETWWLLTDICHVINKRGRAHQDWWVSENVPLNCLRLVHYQTAKTKLPVQGWAVNTDGVYHLVRNVTSPAALRRLPPVAVHGGRVLNLEAQR